MNNKSNTAHKVVMPDIRLITVHQVYAKMREKMKEIVRSSASAAADKKNAVRILNTQKSRIISSGDFGVPCNACHAICTKVVAFNNEYAICDSCLSLASQIMAGGEDHASDSASIGTTAK